MAVTMRPAINPENKNGLFHDGEALVNWLISQIEGKIVPAAHTLG